MWSTFSNQFRNQWSRYRHSLSFTRQSLYRSRIKYPMILAITIPFIQITDVQGQRGPLEISNGYLGLGVFTAALFVGIGYKSSLPKAPHVFVTTLNDTGYVTFNIQNQATSGHKLEFCEDANTTWNAIDIESRENSVNYELGPLEPDKIYSIRIASKSVFGYGEKSKIVKIQTTDKMDRKTIEKTLLQLKAEMTYAQLHGCSMSALQAQYNALQDKLLDKTMKLSILDAQFDAKNLPKSPTLNIKALKDEDSVIVQIQNTDIIAHKLEYIKLDDESGEWKTKEFETESSDMRFTIDGLETNTYYKIRATSRNAFGYGMKSDTVMIKTMDWSVSTLLNLNGGSGGTSGQTVYNAPDGTVVQCSHPTNVKTPMSALFNGDRSNKATYRDIWVAGISNAIDGTLTFSFNGLKQVSHIMVCATNGIDQFHKQDWHRCNYSIDGYTIDGDWVKMCDMMNTANDSMGYFRRHEIKKTLSKIRFNIHNPGRVAHGSSPFRGLCLREIDIYVAKSALNSKL